MDHYFIKDGYHCNLDTSGAAHQHLDSEDLSPIFQVSTYQYAAQVAKRERARSVLDVGCGHGTKLMKFLYPCCSQVTGIDQAHSIDWCRQNHGTGTWLIDDITSDAHTLRGVFDLIVSSDVVEHLPNPDHLLDYIKAHSVRETLVVISTPERDKFHGTDSFGPSPNVSHVREWNKSEFARYLGSRGFQILDHLVVEDYQKPLHLQIRHKLTGVDSKKCQLVLCRAVAP